MKTTIKTPDGIGHLLQEIETGEAMFRIAVSYEEDYPVSYDPSTRVFVEADRN